MISTRNTSIIIVLVTIVALSGCAHQLPIPESDEFGTLVIAFDTENDTPSFGYTYKVQYNPQTAADIQVDPDTAHDYLIIKDFPPGQYTLTGVIKARKNGWIKNDERNTGDMGESFGIVLG